MPSSLKPLHERVADIFDAPVRGGRNLKPRWRHHRDSERGRQGVSRPEPRVGDADGRRLDARNSWMSGSRRGHVDFSVPIGHAPTRWCASCPSLRPPLGRLDLRTASFIPESRRRTHSGPGPSLASPGPSLDLLRRFSFVDRSWLVRPQGMPDSARMRDHHPGPVRGLSGSVLTSMRGLLVGTRQNRPLALWR